MSLSIRTRINDVAQYYVHGTYVSHASREGTSLVSLASSVSVKCQRTDCWKNSSRFIRK